MNETISFNDFFTGEYAWIGKVFLVVFGALLLDFLQRRVLGRLREKLERTENPWDDAFFKALSRPLSILIWVLGIAFAARIVAAQTESEIFSLVTPLRNIGVIAILAWFLSRLITRVQNNIVAISQRNKHGIDVTTADAIGKLLRVSVYITATLVALQTLGFSISGVLAFGGIGGIAVGFAARDLLANFFGGLMIYMDRPFSVGDWVRSPDRDIEGTVEEIGWRLTRIRTFDKRPLYVPNSTFTSIAVENPSRMWNRRIKETIGIRYDDAKKMKPIVADVEEMLRGHPDIDDSQILMVNFDAFAPSSLDFFVYTFTRTTNWSEYHQVKQDVLLKIIDIIDRHGAEIAFPTSTLHVPEPVTLQNTDPANASI